MGSIARYLTNYANPASFGSVMRRRRIALFVAGIERVFAERGAVRIIDLGGTQEYWNILPRGLLAARNVHITTLNLACAKRPGDSRHFRHVEGDACRVAQYDDGAFDIVHANSVIEHVGNWENMRAFANECQRLGRHYFVQTPNFWFPVEPHFVAPVIHWLPTPTRVSLLMRFGLGNHPRYPTLDGAMDAIEGARLLDVRMMRSLFPSGRIVRERFLLLTKSLIATTL
ncbi:MAG: methyltransferase domain-containing protein [Rhodocyclaceae bacterium]